MRKTIAIVAGTALIGALGSASRATLVAYDGFESYTAGSGLNGNSAGNGSTGPNGEFGWTSNWTGVTGINVQAGAPAGTRTAESDDTTDNIVAATRSFTAQSGTVYFSLLFRGTAGVESSDFLHFYLGNSSSTNNNSGGIGDVDTANTLFGARVGTTNGGATVDSAVTYTQGTTYTLVGKLSKVSSANYNRIDLFVNPTSTVEPGAAATQSGDAGISQVSTFSLRTFNLDAGDKYQFDELKIGTTFADVTPEPGSLAVLGVLTGAGLLVRRRRRRRAAH